MLQALQAARRGGYLKGALQQQQQQQVLAVDATAAVLNCHWCGDLLSMNVSLSACYILSTLPACVTSCNNPFDAPFDYWSTLVNPSRLAMYMLHVICSAAQPQTWSSAVCWAREDLVSSSSSSKPFASNC
jgi:hypothetical protein